MSSVRCTIGVAMAGLFLIAPAATAEPPLLSPQPVVRQLVLTGPFDAGLRESTERHLHQAVDSGARYLILELSCAGGDAAAAHDLAVYLLRLTERHSDVRTIAYLTPQARDTASMIALACDQIFLQANAHLGDWEPYLRQHLGQANDVKTWLMELATARGHPALLARGLVDHDLHLRMTGSGDTLAFEEGDVRDSADVQVKPQSRKDPMAFLTLDAQKASIYHIAEKVDSQTDLYRSLGIDGSTVVVVQDDWLDRLGAFFRSVRTRLALVALGMAFLLLEFRFPRATVPAVLATICFVLLFWSHSRLNQQSTALALVLFGLGVVLLALEVSFRPGHSACGIAGGVLLCVSLGLLAYYGQLPHGAFGWGEAGQAFTQTAAGVLVALGLAFVLTRYLPRVRAGARLLPTSGSQPVLPAVAPPTASPPPPAVDGDNGVEQGDLLGAIGATATPLQPTGMVRIGDAFVAALAEDGAGLGTGVRVQVVGMREGRVVVVAV